MATTGTRPAGPPPVGAVAADGAAPPRARRRLHLGPEARTTLAAGAAYLGYAIFITWPLLLHMDSYVVGGGGDSWGALAQWRELIGHNPFVPGTMSDLAAPDGLGVAYALNVASWPSTVLLWGGSTVFGEVAAVNLFVLSGYVLSGVAMYLLALKLTGSRGIAFIAGFAFAFSPYAVTRGAGHWHFVHGWPLVLIAWRMLVLIERPSLRTGAIAGAAVAFGISFTPYYVLFGGVMVVTFLVVGAVLALRGRRVRSFIPPVAVTVAIIGLTLGFYLLVASTDENAPIREGTLAQVWYGVPLQWVIPDVNNILVSDWAREFRESRYGTSGENNVYVGLSILALAIAGLVVLIRRLRRRETSAALLAFPALVVAAQLMIMPPSVDVLGQEVKTFVGHLYDVTTAWRIFIRFVDVGMVGLVVLAAIGLAALTARLDGRRRTAVLAAVLAVVVVDLWAKSPDPANPVPRPAVYERLAALPDGIVADYPIQPAEIPAYDGMLLQDIHGKRVVNGYASGSDEEARALLLSDLSQPETVRRLATVGVRYAIVPDGITIGEKVFDGAPIPGMREVLAGDGRRVYEVTAEPLDSLWFWGRDVLGSEGPGAPRWVTDDRVRLHVDAACDRCRARVVVDVTSFGAPREVKLESAGRSVTARATPEQPGKLVLDIPYFERSAKVIMTFSPGPQSVAEATGGDDPRSFGVGITSTAVDVAPAG